MPLPRVRAISADDLRDGVLGLASVEVSDEELAERGIPLDQAEFVEGLGPAAYTVVELAGGRQYYLRRLEQRPAEVVVAGTLTGAASTLIDELLSALAIPAERVTWREAEDFWQNALVQYDRDAWLRRLGGEGDGRQQGPA